MNGGSLLWQKLLRNALCAEKKTSGFLLILEIKDLALEKPLLALFYLDRSVLSAVLLENIKNVIAVVSVALPTNIKIYHHFYSYGLC